MRRKKDKPLAVGHRGAPRLQRENTIEGFEAALNAGLDGVELDLQPTRDGVLAVHHDPTVDGAPISTVDWSDLSTRHPYIPRLEDVLELMERHPGAHLNIELKSAFLEQDGREEVLARALSEWDHEAKDRTWISCFDPIALIRLHRLDTSLPLALLVSLEEVLQLVPSLPVAGIHADQSLVTLERLRQWHERGMFVFAWTVNDLPAARELVALGIDGLIGDVPRYLLEACA